MCRGGALVLALLLGMVGGPPRAAEASPVPTWAQVGPASTDTTPREGWIFPGRSYDPEIRSPMEYLGYGLGEGVATFARLVPYLEYLAGASDRIDLGIHGESYEGRGIYHAVVTSPDNLERLDRIRDGLGRLADPRTLASDEQEETLLRDLPAVVMLNFGTDGAETAGPEAAVQVLYQLAAATDSMTRRILDQVVVVVVPVQNPDAHQRAVAWYKAFRVGPGGTADPNAAEHRFPWGINSTNHYQVDLNRESVWGTQRETRAMVRLYRRWRPQVFVDNHGEYDTYTGPDYAEPLHAQLTERQRGWLEGFEGALASMFDEHGYEYNAWEYGQFDPGYWDTYPNYTGAVAWTTETTGGGSRGLRFRAEDGSLFTLEDGIIGHMLASEATVRHAAQNRERLLRSYLAYRRSALAPGREGSVTSYALSSSSDARRLATVVNTLRRNGIEVHRTRRVLRLDARPHFDTGGDGTRAERSISLPTGSYVIELSQPESRLARVLLEPEARFSPEFLHKIDTAEGDRSDLFYDITGWSMPLTFHLDGYEVTSDIPEDALAAVRDSVRVTGDMIQPEAGFGYLAAPADAMDVMVRCHVERWSCRVATDAFMIDGRTFPNGTAVVLNGDHDGRDLAAAAREWTRDRGLTLVGVTGPATDRGPALDSDAFPAVSTGRIAVVMDDPVNPSAFGHVWFTFEREWGLEFTAVRFRGLAELELDDYDVVILPDGRYGSVSSALAGAVASQLGAWVRRGGLLIGMRGASAWLAGEGMGVTRVRVKEPPAETDEAPLVPGTILRAAVADRGHPLTLGYESPEIPVMVWSRLALDAGGAEAPLRIVEPERAEVSGFVFPESLDYLAGSPYAVRDRQGAGAVVLFLDDPLFRLFWDGLDRLFLNAVLMGREG